MYMFFGDSNSRQFADLSFGIFCHYVFAGATIKGLGNPRSVSGSRKIIEHAISIDEDKTLVFMFGHVDLDFTLIRDLNADPALDIEGFLRARADLYANAVGALAAACGRVRRVCVCGLQASPLLGEHFIRTTSVKSGVAEDDVIRLSERVDLSAEARGRRLVRFCDWIEEAFRANPLADVLRIDGQMLDDTFRIKDEFLPKNPGNHHAKVAATRPLWLPLLSPYLADERRVE